MLRLQFHDVIFLKTNYYYLMTAMVSLNIKYRTIPDSNIISTGYEESGNEDRMLVHRNTT